MNISKKNVIYIASVVLAALLLFTILISAENAHAKKQTQETVITNTEKDFAEKDDSKGNIPTVFKDDELKDNQKDNKDNKKSLAKTENSSSITGSMINAGKTVSLTVEEESKDIVKFYNLSNYEISSYTFDEKYNSLYLNCYSVEKNPSSGQYVYMFYAFDPSSPEELEELFYAYINNEYLYQYVVKDVTTQIGEDTVYLQGGYTLISSLGNSINLSLAKILVFRENEPYTGSEENLNWNPTSCVLTLSGANLTDYSGLTIMADKVSSIHLEENTVSTIKSTSGNTSFDDYRNECFTLRFCGLTYASNFKSIIEGPGKLHIDGGIVNTANNDITNSIIDINAYGIMCQELNITNNANVEINMADFPDAKPNSNIWFLNFGIAAYGNLVIDKAANINIKAGKSNYKSIGCWAKDLDIRNQGTVVKTIASDCTADMSCAPGTMCYSVGLCVDGVSSSVLNIDDFAYIESVSGTCGSRSTNANQVTISAAAGSQGPALHLGEGSTLKLTSNYAMISAGFGSISNNAPMKLDSPIYIEAYTPDSSNSPFPMLVDDTLMNLTGSLKSGLPIIFDGSPTNLEGFSLYNSSPTKEEVEGKGAAELHQVGFTKPFVLTKGVQLLLKTIELDPEQAEMGSVEPAEFTVIEGSTWEVDPNDPTKLIITPPADVPDADVIILQAVPKEGYEVDMWDIVGDEEGKIFADTVIGIKFKEAGPQPVPPGPDPDPPTPVPDPTPVPEPEVVTADYNLIEYVEETAATGDSIPVTGIAIIGIIACAVCLVSRKYGNK